MKKTLLIVTCALLAQLVSAQTPKWAANAKKAVFSIVTYDKDNNIKATGNGFYIDNQGTALSDYSLFEGATRAVIINANGNQQPVEAILGRVRQEIYCFTILYWLRSYFQTYLLLIYRSFELDYIIHGIGT